MKMTEKYKYCQICHGDTNSWGLDKSYSVKVWNAQESELKPCPFCGCKTRLKEKAKEIGENLSEYFEQYRFEPITTYTVNKIKHDLNEIVPDFYSKGVVKFCNNPLQIEILYNGKIACVLK